MIRYNTRITAISKLNLQASKQVGRVLIVRLNLRNLLHNFYEIYNVSINEKKCS